MDSQVQQLQGLALYVTDGARLLQVTQDAAAIFGAAPAQLVGRAWADLVPARQAAVMERAHSAASDAAQSYPLILDDQHWQVSVQGHGTHITGVMQPQSDRLRAEDALARTRAVQRDMVTFLTTAAHDVTNPVANVTVLADRLRDGFVDLGDGKLQMIDLLEHMAAEAMELIGASVQADAQPNVAACDVPLAAAVENALLRADPEGQTEVTSREVIAHTDPIALRLILADALCCFLPSASPLRIHIDPKLEGWLHLVIEAQAADPVVTALPEGPADRIRHLTNSLGGTMHFTAAPSPTLTCVISGHLAHEGAAYLKRC